MSDAAQPPARVWVSRLDTLLSPRWKRDRQKSDDIEYIRADRPARVMQWNDITGWWCDCDEPCSYCMEGE